MSPSPLHPFPLPPQRSASVDVLAYGCALLTYLLAVDVYVYGLLTDDDLEIANHASQYIVTSAGILPIAVDNISAVRHEIMSVLRHRQAERELLTTLAARTAPEPHKPNVGPMAPLSPEPITRPPSTTAQKVEIEF